MNFPSAINQRRSGFVYRIALIPAILFFLGFTARLHAADQPPAIAGSNSVSAMTAGPARVNPSTQASLVENTNMPATPLTNPPIGLDDKYKLTIGDRLSFRIVEDGDSPKPLIVTDSGDVEFPYIGRVPSENKTCLQLAGEVETNLEKDYYYHATVLLAVDVMTRGVKNHGRVYLVGAVRAPGPVEIPNDEVLTLSKAILRAGGFTDYANRRQVTVTRKESAGKDEKKTFVVDVGEIFDKGKIETDLNLESDDLIYIPDRLFRF